MIKINANPQFNDSAEFKGYVASVNNINNFKCSEDLLKKATSISSMGFWEWDVKNDKVIWGSCMVSTGDADAMVTGNTRLTCVCKLHRNEHSSR